MADGLRFVAVILGLVAASQLPGILSHRIHGWRMWVVVTAMEVLLLSKIATVLAKLGASIVWYGTPALLVADVLILVYVVSGTAWFARWRRCDRGQYGRDWT